MDVPLRRDVEKARRIGKSAMSRPMRIRGTRFIKNEYRQVHLRLTELGVLAKMPPCPLKDYLSNSGEARKCSALALGYIALLWAIFSEDKLHQIKVSGAEASS